MFIKKYEIQNFICLFSGFITALNDALIPIFTQHVVDNVVSANMHGVILSIVIVGISSILYVVFH